MARTVILTTTDAEGVTHKREVTEKQARMSILISEMIADDDEDSPEIPLLDVNVAQLDRVVQFMKHHCENPMADIVTPIRSSEMDKIVSDWDAKFMDLPQDEVLYSALAANYLDIPSYLDLVCTKIATMIRDKEPEEVKSIFHIKGDLTPEQEEAVRKNNQWVFEVNPAQAAAAPAAAVPTPAVVDSDAESASDAQDTADEDDNEDEDEN